MTSTHWSEDAKVPDRDGFPREKLIAALRSPGSARFPNLFLLLAVSAAYYLLARLGVALGIPPDGIAVFWPPNAVILCTFLLAPPRHWWVFAVGLVCAEIAGDVPAFSVPEALGFGVINCAEGALSAFFLRRLCDDRFSLSSSRQLLLFVIIAVLGAPALAGLAGSAIYVLGGAQQSYLLLWRTWWVGDAVGIVALAPLILTLWRLFKAGPARFPLVYLVELAIALLLLSAATVVAFKHDWLIASDYYRLFYIYPLLVWIALRGGILGAAAGGVVVTAVVSWMAVAGEIPMGFSGRFEDIFFLQQFLAVTMLSTLTLAVLVQEMVALNRELATRIEHTKSQKTILQERDKAERANRAKTNFLAHMSHELRTPLNAIIGFTSSIRSETFGPIENERYREYLKDIDESAQHLLSLINDTIDISRIEGGSLKLSDDVVSPRDAVDHVIRMVQNTVAQRGIALNNRVPSDLPRLRCDEVRLRQILVNVIGNAAKFSFDKGAVDISAVHDQGQVAIVVRDQGPGIPADKLHSVFERYHQLSSDPHVRAQGFGLGLYVSRMLMEAHGGHIRIDSLPDEGTTVTLEFPRERAVLQ